MPTVKQSVFYLKGSSLELLIGAGSSRVKQFHLGESEWKELITLDINEDHNPDVVHDLEVLPYPFEDNQFDEIHAYEVLEHTGAQGDYKFFFAQFSELWRILKPDGVLYATVPEWKSIWAWGDPSHKRIINEGTIVFLSQKEYEQQVGITAMSDFRYLYKADFNIVHASYEGDQFCFALRAIKS
jgi:SAM-dependent methyltransferase